MGPYMYPLYTSPLFEIAKKHKVNMHMYADDTQVYLACDKDSVDDAVDRLQAALIEIKKWMADNHLKLNETKTEFLLIDKTSAKNDLQNVSIQIGQTTIHSKKAVKNIGAVLDRQMSMEEQVSKVVRVCYSHLRQIAHIRPFLTKEATETLVNSSVTSRLDYANSLLYGTPSYLTQKLQNIQNNAARLILGKRKFDHVTPLLIQLHWLPIDRRIEFKVNLLTFKALKGLAPQYLKLLISEYEPSRALRSASNGLLTERRTRTKIGDRAFSVCAPKLWKALPPKIRSSDSVSQFKAALKTFYFKKYFE